MQSKVNMTHPVRVAKPFNEIVEIPLPPSVQHARLDSIIASSIVHMVEKGVEVRRERIQPPYPPSNPDRIVKKMSCQARRNK